MAAPPIPTETLTNWRHHLQDEADAAFLYRVLAGATPSAKGADVYRRLAEVEDRHAGLWRRVLAEHGVDVATPAPSARTRFLAWTARLVGPGLLLPMLVREEGQEVKGYLDLYRETDAGSAKDAALVLARESAEHAQTLGKMAGAEGEPWHHAASGGFLRNVVYGFNDGLTANFGLVAGVIGAEVAPHIILVSGLAGMIADALSMGSSGYLAAKSEQEVYAHEIAMEREEIQMMPEVEEEELALLYEAKGVDVERARRMAREVMADPKRALEEKVREELKIGESHTTPLKEGWITGLATAIGALIPVAPFLFLQGQAAIWTAFSIAMLSHFGVGAARSFFTGRGVFRSGVDMFVVGLGVAGVGYVIGDLVAKWLS
jgi:VIT1/CCC1 family predicted Fe2+/Mn2+ transporter